MTGFARSIGIVPRIAAVVVLVVALAAALPVAAQVFTVTPQGVDGKIAEFHPTNVALSTAPLTTHNREDLLRFLQSEQGFSMRPLPIATITIHANGKMEPNGSDYLNTIRSKGLSVKAGTRVVITDVKIEKERIVLDLNGGPEHKHKFLRHIQVGMDPSMTTPVVHDDPQAPSGSRIVLVFAHDVPDVTGMQVEDLIKPVVDFSLKTPQQAYTDTLPPMIRKAILAHHVLVGMNEEMVVSALGRPKDKIRENDGDMPFEEWIYGEAPQEVQFVRFNSDRVIRVETADVGKPPVIRTGNEMGDYWSKQPAENTRIVKLGDQAPVSPDAETAPRKPPTLRNPGETLPADKDANTPQMAPVQFPKDQSNGQGGSQTAGGQGSSGSQQPANGQSGQQQNGQQKVQPLPPPPTAPNEPLRAVPYPGTIASASGPAS